MSDFLKTGAQFLADQQRNHCAAEIQYQRQASSITIKATKARSEFDVTDDTGVLTRAESRDFLIHRTDLEIDGDLTEPAVGDRILDPVEADEDDAVYEVASPAPNTPPWGWADDHRIRYRIHTKYIGLLSTLPT
jgi:hypothetical protein